MLMAIVLGTALLCDTMGSLVLDQGETAAYIRDEIARGSKRVVVPRRRARIETKDDAYFTLKNVSNVEIDFQGCDFFGTRRVRALGLENCTNVTVRNLKFDYDPLPFTQARITSVDSNHDWDLEVIEGYPTPPAEYEYWPMQVYDRENHELINEMRSWNGFKLTKTGDRTYHVTGGSIKHGAVGDIAVWSVRDSVQLREPCTVFLKNCVGCRLEDITLYSTVIGFGMFELQCSGNEYVRCTIDRRPPETDIRRRGVRRLRSGNHDAFHSKMATRGPVLDGCRFAYHCDDAVNLSSFYGIVTDSDGSAVRISDHSALSFVVPMPVEQLIRQGDVLQVLRRDGSNGPSVHVVAVEGNVPTSAEQLAFLKSLNMWPGCPERLNRILSVRLGDGESLSPGDAVVPERLLCRNFAIRNCHFGPHRALGMRIRASDGIIESNKIERTTGSAIWMGPETEWPEGGMSHNVTVRGNEILGCGKVGLYVGGRAAHRREVAPDAHHGIRIVDNRITGSVKPMDVRGCRDGVVRDNVTVPLGTNLRGVMLPMRNLTAADFETLADWGVGLVRYQMTKAFFQKGPDKGGFASYAKWLDGKLDHLVGFVIPECRKRGMKVVVDLHEPPGGREATMEWSIYYNQEHLDQFVDCWRKIAARVKGNEDVVYGYDLLNEPVQKRPAKTLDYLGVYERTAKIVREIDAKTPIIVESRDWDAPEAFAELKPIGVDNVIYEVHMYRPQAFTHQGTGASPKTVGAKWPDLEKGWNRDFIRERLAAVRDFERKYGAKIYVGEFSAIAWGEGAEKYLADCIAVFSEYGWDWTYHAFREWEPWSVEHETPGPNRKSVVSEDNARRRVLLEGLRK